MGEAITLGELDQRLVAALQLDGRAPWSRVARALDASESTVARRGQLLLDSGAVAVTGAVDGMRCGTGVPAHVRLRCRPGAAGAVAGALAAVPQARSVAVAAGDTDVVAELAVPGHRAAGAALAGLPRPDDVVHAETLVVVRRFAVAEEWDPGLLAPDAAALLRPAGVPGCPRERREPEPLTEQERAVADLLAAAGRATYAQLAAALGVSESTAARRVDSLVRRGCLRFRTVFPAALLGFGVEFVLWLDVAPGDLESAGMRLAREPSTRSVGATAGRSNLCVHGVLPGHADLYPYLTGVLGALPGVRAVETTLLAATLKDAGLPVRAGGLVEGPP
ncbi:hypothetical protein BJF78_23015 [Pseudonocardia sp. CNS-139]|nr:hypothetical protein BJF78_23015 [Pseudonocardia sp. CNS-139]